MFDKNAFVKSLEQHIAGSKLQCAGAWALASNIFVAKVRQNGDEICKYYFYYDMDEVHFCNILDLSTDLQVIANNIDILAITGDYHDTVRVACFADHIETEFQAFGFARQLMVARKNHEILWLRIPTHTLFF